MPEGDTIFRAARTLRTRLVGKPILTFRTTVPNLAHAHLVGRRITSVDAHGKNLTVTLDDGRVLVTHMRMTGSWHVYRPGERWYLPEHRARLVIEVDDCVAVCFSAPVIELHASMAHASRLHLDHLGPDILSSTFDGERVARRMIQQNANVTIGETLLDQRVLCGIGNVYKSETLFVERVSPFVTCMTLSHEQRVSLVLRAKTLMDENLAPGSGMRTTRNHGSTRHWVYRRSGEACFECGSVIQMQRQGNVLRSTYFCSECQRSPFSRSIETA